MKQLLFRTYLWRTTRRFSRRSGGQALVEFAFAGGLFLTGLIAVFQFGVTIWQYNSVANLAQEGARYASMCGSLAKSSGKNCDVAAFLQTRAPGVVATKLVVGSPKSGGGSGGFGSSCSGTSVPTPSDTCNNSTLSNMDPGEVVCVQVQKKSGVLLPLTLQATAHMIMAR